MKFGLFASAMAATASAVIVGEDMKVTDDGDFFGQVLAETLDMEGMIEDGADFLMQIDSEERSSLGQILVQTQSMAADFISNLGPEDRQRWEQNYAQTKSQVFDWLSNLQEADQAQVATMLSQTGYGQYFMQSAIPSDMSESLGNYFSQISWSPIDEEDLNTDFSQIDSWDMAAGDEVLGEVADYLAELSDD